MKLSAIILAAVTVVLPFAAHAVQPIEICTDQKVKIATIYPITPASASIVLSNGAILHNVPSEITGIVDCVTPNAPYSMASAFYIYDNSGKFQAVAYQCKFSNNVITLALDPAGKILKTILKQCQLQ
jgi:hypothetical protein